MTNAYTINKVDGTITAMVGGQIRIVTAEQLATIKATFALFYPTVTVAWDDDESACYRYS